MGQWIPVVLLAGAILALLGAMVVRGEPSLLFLALFILLLPAGIAAALWRWWPQRREDADAPGRGPWRRLLSFAGVGLVVAAAVTLLLGLWWSGTAPGNVLLVAGIFLLPPAALISLTAVTLGRPSRLPRLVHPDETILYRGRAHWAVFLPAALLLLLAVVLALGPFGAIGYTAAAVLYLLALPGEGARALLMFTRTEALVTDRRVMLASGLLRRRPLLALHENVEAIGVARRWPGSMLGYGKISVICTDGDTRVLHMMEAPYEFRDHLHSARTPHRV